MDFTRIKKSFINVGEGAVHSFQDFPLAMASALAFALVTAFRIQVDWPRSEGYNFIFDCLQLSLTLGSGLGLVTVAYARRKGEGKKDLLLANLVAGLGLIITFFLLYNLGPIRNVDSGDYVRMKDIALARVTVFTGLSLLFFVVFIRDGTDDNAFSKALFFVQRAFWVALVYGLVIEIGTSSIAGAIQVLLYRNMSYKVYMHLGTLSGFLAYAIFVGHFHQVREASRHPEGHVRTRFVEVLFESILAPLALILTLVLLIWSAKTLITREEVSFLRLSSIASSYAFIGIWLHMMLTDSQSNLSNFYKRVYPYAGLVIMFFEIRALFVQVSQWGIKPREYFFIFLCIFAVLSLLLLIVRQARGHIAIVLVFSVLTIILVSPGLAYDRMPIKIQVSRLERILQSEGMLVDHTIRPSERDIGEEKELRITDAIDYLAGQEEAFLPDWIDKDLNKNDVFEERLGFEKAWPESDDFYGDYLYSQVSLPLEPIYLRDYDWGIVSNMKYDYNEIYIEGERGSYSIDWRTPEGTEIPELEILLDGREILKLTTEDYLAGILEKYPLAPYRDREGSIEDMTLSFETEEVKGLLVFRYVSINESPKGGSLSYWLELQNIYIKEK